MSPKGSEIPSQMSWIRIPGSCGAHAVSVQRAAEDCELLTAGRLGDGAVRILRGSQRRGR